ncbi:MAG TPA: hypothetical protein VHY22_08565 [Chthoniobacteraceae bacterium]|jgi:hypothetical protein|nr:hypothetical protein [Chthoniobacteraceae bacterium]
MEKDFDGRHRGSGRLSTFRVIIASLLLPAAAACGAIVVSKPITVNVGGRQIQFTAGQEVILIGVNDGIAMVRVTLPNGSLTVAQLPVSDLRQSGVTHQAPPGAAATPLYRAAPLPSPALPTPRFDSSLNSGATDSDSDADLGSDALPATPGLATYTETKARKDKNQFTVRKELWLSHETAFQP